MTEITLFRKHGGPLTKRISLAADGSIRSDGSACVMASGSASRLRIADIGEFASVVDKSRSEEALTLGALRDGLPDTVQVTTKNNLNGQPDTIARTAADIRFRKNMPALALLDHDTKGMPEPVAEAIKRRGGFWPTLTSIVPQLGRATHLIRHSTSAGLYRTDTGQRFAGSGGLHGYLPALNGADIGRFLSALHDRCWIAGFGWMMLGAGGQLLERSIVDRMVGAPERLVFEGPPILEPPLSQDRTARKPVIAEGAALDTVAACPPLTLLEKSELDRLKARERQRLATAARKAREAFIAEQAERLASRRNISTKEAAEQIEKQCSGTLLPDITLPFDDDELDGCTVADVLQDPERFEGATLADPLEGVGYGRCKARIMLGSDGTPWINSFAHGRTTYDLKHNAASVRAAIAAATSNEDAAATFVRLAVNADLTEVEIETVRNELVKQTKNTKTAINRTLKDARTAFTGRKREEQRERRAAEDTDPRPTITWELATAPMEPVVDALNDVIGTATVKLPVPRDVEGFAARGEKTAVQALHAFTPGSANAEEEKRACLSSGSSAA